VTSHAVKDAGRAFDHVLVLMFENQYRGYVLNNPYMRRLARSGCQLGNYFGVMHPSQTNYIASIAGSLCNVTSDLRPPVLDDRTIVDLIEEAPGRLQWKAYMESYVPGDTPWSPDFVPADLRPYVVKHNQFSSFSSVLHDETRWRRIDNEAALFADLLNDELPEYSWFTPNVWSDGHWLVGSDDESDPRAPGLVDQLASWLEAFFHRLRFPGPDSHLPPRTLVVVTFDESDFESDYLPQQGSAYDGPNQIYTVLLGDCVRPGFEEEGYNHYSLLRTIERNFGLDHLGRNDAGANWFQFLWNRHFAWSDPEVTPIAVGAAPGSPLAATQHAGALFVALAADDGVAVVRTRTIGGSTWSAPQRVPMDASRSVALASTFDELLLVAIGADGSAGTARFDIHTGWRVEDGSPIGGELEACAMTSFSVDSRIMLAVRDASGKIWSSVRGMGTWGDRVPVDTAPNGDLTLATLGASVLLIVRGDDTSIQLVSYNSEAFNTVSVDPNPYGGPWDDTTLDAWSPSTFPVTHFSSRPDTSHRNQPLARPYSSAGPMAAATLDGVVHLIHPGPETPLLQTETFSLSGLMTPAKPVSYKNYDSKDHSNGFGTFAEGGWSHQSALFGSECPPGAPLACARAGEELVLLYRSTPGGSVDIRTGRYAADRHATAQREPRDST
jgi:hypothetical protein